MARPALLALAAVAGCLATGDCAADERPPLVLEQIVPLPQVAGRIDHMAVDLSRRRLFIAELGNDSVDVVDLAKRRLIHRIDGLKAPQGVGFLKAADRIAVANAGDGSVRFYHGSDFSQAAVVRLGDDADDMRVDTRTGALLVGYGAGGIAVMGPRIGTVRAVIRLPAHPEGFQLAPDGHRVFVNVPDARQIAIVDLMAARQVATWSVAGVRANFPMAIDSDSETLAVVFRDPPTLVLLDTVTGAVFARLRSCGDADDVFFDERRRRIYVSCGSGDIDIFGETGAAARKLARIRTRAGARTSLFVPEFDRLFVAAPASGPDGKAELLVFRPVP